MRPQSLGRPDRLLNRAAWHLAVSKRERPALGRFATRRLCNAGGSAVTTRYLVREQKWTLLTNPAMELACITRDNEGVAFLFSQETSNINRRHMSFFRAASTAK